MTHRTRSRSQHNKNHMDKTIFPCSRPLKPRGREALQNLLTKRVFTRSSQLTHGSQRVSEKPTLFLTPILPRFHCVTCLPRKVRHLEAGEPSDPREKKAKSLNRWTRRERLGCVSLVHLCRLLRLLRHESSADGRTSRVTLVCEDPTCPDRCETLLLHCFVRTRVYTFISLMYWISTCIASSHRLEGSATHPSHRRCTHGRN